MSVALLVITDGRDDYLEQATRSLRQDLHGGVTEHWMFDDTGDDGYRAELRRRYPGWRHVDGGPRQGFGGAIKAAWHALACMSHADCVWHHEQDFVLNAPVDVDALAAVLDANPELVQLALRRQPWNEVERAAGGVVEQYPDSFTEHDWQGQRWLEHRRWFTTNPSLYRRSLCAEGWPDGEQSEGRFGIGLLERYPTWRFGYWGARDSGEAVTHIGLERAGVGY